MRSMIIFAPLLLLLLLVVGVRVDVTVESSNPAYLVAVEGLEVGPPAASDLEASEPEVNGP